jgi:hypothetical protein
METQGLVTRTLNYLEKRRQNVLRGGINSIPSPFKRFDDDFIGFEQKMMYIVSSFTKGGKTQFTLSLLFDALEYAFNNPEKVRLKIFYIMLEETDEGMTQRYISYLLNRLSGIRISPRDLRSSKNDNPLDENILILLQDEKYQKRLEFFEKVFDFSTVSNPTGILKIGKQYAEENGIVHKKKTKYKDEFGVTKETETFDWYEPNDPQEYKFMVIDHLSLCDPERGMTQKEAMDKISEYMAKYLRNRYGYTIIVIQQQSAETESNDSFKLGRIRPSVRGLSDTKYTARDCNMMLGLFSPYKFNLDKYLGYDIIKLKDHVRFLEVCVGRDGSQGGIIALFFDGATCSFYELPPPDDILALEKVYKYIEELDKPKKVVKTFLIKTFNQLKHGKLLHYFRKIGNW